jgi:L-threonylcarbamoyladenylate synthase
MLDQISIAVEKLKQGDVVGVPTETVYGLAAVISNSEAINKIFTTKQRPFFDPLIVHVNGIEQAKELTTVWGEAVNLLAQEFWPGPLTLVLPKKNISDIITSGLPTVGIRCPAHNVTLEIIAKVGEPLAAPSANRFGKTSPTSRSHVVDEFGDNVFVVEGGSCNVGIESTIIAVSESLDTISISVLRAGVITPSQMESVLAKLKKQVVFIKSSEKIIAPGQIEHHYMPQVPILWIAREKLGVDQDLKYVSSLISDQKFRYPTELKLNPDPSLAARELYSQMRICSEPPADLIVCIHEEFQKGEKWDSILDRLKRASTYKLLNNLENI